MGKRILFGWVLLGLSIVGWPLSAFTFAREEPQAILGLSWGAIILTALNVVLVEEVKEDE